MRLLKEKTDVIAKKCMGVTANVSETSLREIEDIFYVEIVFQKIYWIVDVRVSLIHFPP